VGGYTHEVSWIHATSPKCNDFCKLHCVDRVQLLCARRLFRCTKCLGGGPLNCAGMLYLVCFSESSTLACSSVYAGNTSFILSASHDQHSTSISWVHKLIRWLYCRYLFHYSCCYICVIAREVTWVEGIQHYRRRTWRSTVQWRLKEIHFWLLRTVHIYMDCLNLHTRMKARAWKHCLQALINIFESNRWNTCGVPMRANLTNCQQKVKFHEALKATIKLATRIIISVVCSSTVRPHRRLLS